MNIILNFLLLVVIVNYSYERDVVRWVITNDQTIIDESLKQSLRHMNLGGNIYTLKSKVTNIICKRRFFNGFRIKLYFKLEDQIWKCFLYKAPVETLGIQWESCTQTLDDDSREEVQSQQSNKIIPEESQVNNDDKVEEEDDEAKIDALNQKVQEKETNNDKADIDNNN
ncbi:unnamed protein product, partial [Rotaria sp. Silwood2]